MTCFPSHPWRGQLTACSISISSSNRIALGPPTPELGWAPTRIAQERSQHTCAGQTGSRCPLGQKRMSAEVQDVQDKVTCDLFLAERRPLVIPSAGNMEPFRNRSRRYEYTLTQNFVRRESSLRTKTYHAPSRLFADSAGSYPSPFRLRSRVHLLHDLDGTQLDRPSTHHSLNTIQRLLKLGKT